MDIVIKLKHNYQSTLGGYFDLHSPQWSRRAIWKDEDGENDPNIDLYDERENMRQVRFASRKSEGTGLQSEIRALWERSEKMILKEAKPVTPALQKFRCYNCGDIRKLKRKFRKR